ncbi:MAG: hypothetical protein IKL10_05920 [Clostridia bacterium]|nr:hypothetical protein [Clostridia bacterium]
MNIQLPVLIWTVICFLLMMIVLKYLLFKPVLEVIDKRKEKIAKAEEKKAEEKRLMEEHEKRLEIFHEDAKIQRENLIKSELELIRVKSKTDIEEVKAGRVLRFEEYKKNTEKEKEDIISAFNASSDEIVKAFADRLISQ